MARGDKNKDSVADPSQGFKAHITPDKDSGLDEFDAVIAYYAPSNAPPGEQPPGGGPGKPPGIWGGGNEPFPTPPISGIPGLPGYEPPPPVIILPPVPQPIPEPPPEPDAPPFARKYLVMANSEWQWIVLPPPASVKPPGDFGWATPKG